MNMQDWKEICPDCGKDVTEAKFCSNCGALLTKASEVIKETKVEIPEENVHLPLGNGDLEQNCADYEKAMEDYVVDIQLLGIGSNGHIGFNEPGTSFDSLTHVVELKESTRKDNARFFDPLGEEVPTHACTMGIATIMKSRKVLVVANGANKADAVYNMVKGEVTEECPASVLQRHSDVVVIVDKAAGAKL